MSQLLANQCQANVFPVLVTIADNDTARAGRTQYRHQLRFAACLQANPPRTVLNDLLHYTVLLIDLDRIYRGITSTIILLPHGVRKTVKQGIHPVMQDIDKPH